MLGPKTEEDLKPVEKKKAPKAPKVSVREDGLVGEWGSEVGGVR